MLFYMVLKSLVLPPATQAALGVLALLLYRQWRRTALALLAIAVLSLWILSMPATGAFCARWFETVPPLDLPNLDRQTAEAIVVLGGGAYRNAPEFGGADNVRPLTLERLRYAAHLQRRTGLPLAVAGGLGPNMETTEGALMQRALVEDFGIPVTWVEQASTTTAENATFSRRTFPFTRIILVTHALHMPRARRVFEQAGFNVTPAPLGFFSATGTGYAVHDFVPSLHGLTVMHYVVYEALGTLWYRWGNY